MRDVVTISLLLAAMLVGCAEKPKPEAAARGVTLRPDPDFAQAPRLPEAEQPTDLVEFLPPPAVQQDVATVEDQDDPLLLASAAEGSAGHVVHTIRKNDTLWSLARRYLGEPQRWPQIMDLNPGLVPTRLRIGQTIKIPAR